MFSCVIASTRLEPLAERQVVFNHNARSCCTASANSSHQVTLADTKRDQTRRGLSTGDDANGNAGTCAKEREEADDSENSGGGTTD
jgi:hypothetical protein